MTSPHLKYYGLEQAAGPQSTDLARIARECLHLEVHTFPKPGLVSHRDAGSHSDMDAATFDRSALALQPYFQRLAEAGADNAPMHRLRQIGLEAETAMMRATGGVNTHRGAIFGMGLLCAAWGLKLRHDSGGGETLGAVVRRRWGQDIWRGPRRSTTHGEVACRAYGVGGARGEAAAGFPSVYEVGLPALRAARRLTDDPEAQRVHACMALIARVPDTNLLHRGGADGLRFAQDAAQRFLNAGGVTQPTWAARATDIHTAFVARHLSPGGSADLLAMTLFVSAAEDAS